MDSSKRSLGIKKSKILSKIAFYVLILIVFGITILPILVGLSGSFQPEWAIKGAKTTLIPTPEMFTLQNYQEILADSKGNTAFQIYVLNSLKVAAGTVILTMSVSIFGAYGLARYHFKGRALLARLMLFLYVFPTILSIIPIYRTLASLKMVNTHMGLVLVHSALVAPFCTWLLRSFFNAIPIDVEEAAYVDGANRFRVVVSIILPLAAPGILASGMYALIYSWGESMFSSILIDSGSLRTIPIALAGFMNHIDQKWGRLLAGSMLNVIPLLICFIPLLRTFLKGFTEGAVKE